MSHLWQLLQQPEELKRALGGLLSVCSRFYRGEEELCNRRGLDSTLRNNCRELVPTEVLFSATVPTTGSTILPQKMPDSNRLFCEYLSMCNRNLEMAVTKGGVALGSYSYQGILPPAP